MEQAAAIDDRMIGQVFSIGSERQRTAFLNTVLWQSLRIPVSGPAAPRRSPAAVRAALDLVLRRKAIAAEALATQRDAVLGGKYPALEPRLRELAALRMQIARATLAGPGPEGSRPTSEQLAEWTAQEERLEAELARQIPEMNLEQKLRAADRRAVALGLPEGVALVEFVRFHVFDFQAVPARGESQWKPARYVAFVLPAGEPDDVRMIDLGEAEPIDRMIADFRAGDHRRGRDRATAATWPSGATRPARPATASDAGSALRAAVFDRLAPALGGRTRLLLAPDGDLARLPFEVLPTADGRRLIDDYQISYLSCGRDVLRFGAAATGQPAAAAGRRRPRLRPRDGRQPQTGSADLGRQPATPTPTSAAAPREPGPRPARRRHHFHRLPGTRAEGERIAALLGVPPWLDAAALEGRLKAACRSPRILHLATHGFFLADQERDPDREAPGLGVDSASSRRRTGGPAVGTAAGEPDAPLGPGPGRGQHLARPADPPEEAEDGLLTAEDVTGLDLLATELVVLSACETGLGQVHVGEGVFGLRRAFVLAGAKTLVMSLWKVPDEPTRELMEDFYRRLLAGQGRAEALRQAQLAMKAKYPDPFYWGAFICQGDPAPWKYSLAANSRWRRRSRGADDRHIALDCLRLGGGVDSSCCARGNGKGRQSSRAATLREMLKPSPSEPIYGLGIWLAKDDHQRREGEPPFVAKVSSISTAASSSASYVIPSHDIVIVRLGENARGWEESALPNAVLKGVAGEAESLPSQPMTPPPPVD